MTLRWSVLTAVVPDALEDEVAAVLGSGSLGVEIAPSGPGTSRLRIYVENAEAALTWRERARAVLSAHGIEDADSQLGIDAVEDERWVERWQASLSPIPLGKRFVVVPGASVEAAPGRDPIQLVPGMAFGTGEHPTTRMCAAALERSVAAGSRWLDLGTGTGLLAIVAARCGASRVLALDHAAQAIEVANSVVAANAAGGFVEIREGSIGDLGGETFDGVVANIQSSFFLGAARGIAGVLAEEGLLIASGVLVEDLPEVEGALTASGLTIMERLSDGPWAQLSARRGRT